MQAGAAVCVNYLCLCAQACARAMRDTGKGGSIVNVSSEAASYVTGSTYCMDGGMVRYAPPL